MKNCEVFCSTSCVSLRSQVEFLRRDAWGVGYFFGRDVPVPDADTVGTVRGTVWDGIAWYFIFY